MGSAYSEVFDGKIGVHQGSVLWPLLFGIVVVALQKMQKGCDQ